MRYFLHFPSMTLFNFQQNINVILPKKKKKKRKEEEEEEDRHTI